MQNRTETVANPLHGSCHRCDVKGASCTHRNLAHIRSHLDSARDHGTHNITRLDARTGGIQSGPCLFRASPWKTVAIHLAHLTALSSSCFDEQGNHPTSIKHDWRTFPHTCRVQPVRFLKGSRD